MDILFGIAFTAHLGLRGDYNEVHPSINIEKDNYIAGLFYNSEFNPSVYAGYRFVQNEDLNWEIAAVTGYPSAPVAPMARLNYKNLFMSVAYEDFQGERLGLVVGIEFKF